MKHRESRSRQARSTNPKLREGAAIAAALLAALFGGWRLASCATSQPVARAGDAAPLNGTTILVLAARKGRIDLVSSAAKPFACPKNGHDHLAFEVMDEPTGRLLATGAFPSPELCPCDRPEAVHPASGCVAVRHEAVVRLKVPHRAPRERIRLREAGGAELGSFVIEAPR